MIQITPYHLTPEDLEDLDKKTREGMQPLLDALNITLGPLAGALATPQDDIVSVTLVTDAAVADSFPLVFRHNLSTVPRWVGMVCVPADPDHSLTTPFVMQGFSVTAAGLVSVPYITGLLVTNSYRLTFLVKA